MFCHKCGAKARDNQDFCMRCGAKLLKRTTKNSSSTDSAISGERTSKVQTPSLWVESAEPLAVQWASTESVRPDNISSKKEDHYHYYRSCSWTCHAHRRMACTER